MWWRHLSLSTWRSLHGWHLRYDVVLISTSYSAQSELATVSAASATFTLVMAQNMWYEFTCTTACYIKQTDAATAATAASGSQLLPANVIRLLRGSHGSRLTVIRDTADGKASLTPCEI